MALTPEQINLIQELHRSGAGYKAIASKLGISREHVRYHCQKIAPKPRADLKDTPVAGHCKLCKRVLKQTSIAHRAKFCSELCRRKWWKDHPEAKIQSDTASYRITCANCGLEFSSYGNNHRRFCSHSCYIEYRYQKGGS